MIIQRRAFIAGLAATLAAPAIVRAASIMPVKVVRSPYLWGTSPFDLTATQLSMRGQEACRRLAMAFDPMLTAQLDGFLRVYSDAGLLPQHRT